MSDNKTNVELSGKYKSTTNGNVDWYYGGGEEAWASKADAVAGVPSSVRSGRTVGILDNGKIVEYVWEPNAIGDEDLVEKHLSKFFSDLSPVITSSESFGSIPEETSLSFFKDKTFSKIFETALFPEVPAYIDTPKSLTLSGITQTEMEVGTSISPTLISTYNPGTINNGNDTLVGNLTGSVTSYQLKNVQGDNIIDQNSSPATNSFSHSLSNFKAILGINSWEAEVSYAAGVETYVSSYGNPGSNLSGDQASGTISVLSNPIYGRYKFWFHVGTENSSPTATVPVRALSNTGLLDGDNSASFRIPIPAGAASAEVSIYVPSGRVLNVTDEVNLGINITSEFLTTNVNIEDAGGTSTSYVKYTRITGPTGYQNPTAFNVSIM